MIPRFFARISFHIVTAVTAVTACTKMHTIFLYIHAQILFMMHIYIHITIMVHIHVHTAFMMHIHIHITIMVCFMMHSIHTATNTIAIVLIFHFLATLCTVMRTIVCIFPKFFITYIIPTVTIKRTRCATLPYPMYSALI